MPSLYTQSAGVYDEIYQTLFDYDKEYAVYSSYLSSRAVKSVLEVGCGTGHLAKRFIANGYDYLGLDLNQEMLDIATLHTVRWIPHGGGEVFKQADMRHFELPSAYDASIITGRTISYLLTNQDVIDALKSIYNCLKNNGLLIFDAIDAVPLFTHFDEVANSTLETQFGENSYKRTSVCKPNLTTGWTWDWASVYFQKKNDAYVEIGNDFATLRAFTKDEMSLFLAMSGFKLIEIVDKETYTWRDAFFIAQKI